MVHPADHKESGQRRNEYGGQDCRNAGDFSRTGRGLRVHAVQMRQILHAGILSNLSVRSNFSSEIEMHAQRTDDHRATIRVIGWVLDQLNIGRECQMLPKF